MDKPRHANTGAGIIISAVSGTYNRLQLLERMVASVRKSVGELPYEIILVDGGSTDGTQAWCKAQPDVTLIEQRELLGAIKAFNAGFEIARGHYVAILNDDIEVNGDTLTIAAGYLDEHPSVGMVAFKNIIKSAAHSGRAQYQAMFGYLYGQCCLVRRWLGEWAGWWGHEGMHTYGGDTVLSLRLWEMGWPTVKLEGCSINDYVHDDGLRKINSASWRGGSDPDVVKFSNAWGGRLPAPDRQIPALFNTVLQKAAAGNLRTLCFKTMYRHTDKERTGMIDAFAQYGPTKQINQKAEVRMHGVVKYQSRVIGIIDEFKPDLVMFQSQRPGDLEPQTAHAIRQKSPDVVLANFDGDPHYPLLPWHFEIARPMHLQLIISPTLFPQYAAHGIGVAYWPIAVEHEYLEAKRGDPLMGPDVIFLGSYYGEGTFPESRRRGEVVLALAESGLRFDLYGSNWESLGLPRAKYTAEQHDNNAGLYAQAKMALSISQAAELWGYTSNRLYNICATGCPALVQRFAGMEMLGFVDGKTCIVWTDVEDMLEKARWYLESDKRREAIGRAGRRLIRERHTWARRVETLFAIIEGLEGGNGC